MSYFTTFNTKSGCGSAGNRGVKTLYSRNSKPLDECQKACLNAGPKVCMSLEYGGSMNGYRRCTFWSGTCTYQPDYDSTIYFPSYNTTANKESTSTNKDGLCTLAQCMGITD